MWYYYCYELNCFCTVLAFRRGSLKPRQRGADKVIARLVEVPPAQTERYYLRMLLLHQTGFTCDQDLRTVNDVVYDTHKDACIALNLLQNDTQHQHCLEFAANKRRPFALRVLFAHQVYFE